MWLAQGCFPHNLKISLQRWHALIFGHLTKSFFGSRDVRHDFNKHFNSFGCIIHSNIDEVPTLGMLWQVTGTGRIIC